jgi:nitrite reductase/ring-hydroxylating ferredoxin subunit
MSVITEHDVVSSSGPDLPRIATYQRALPVSLERLYENAIDWAHLPYLHRSTFARIDCLEAGEWGFRAQVWQRAREDGQPLVIELRLERSCCRWITRTLEGPGRGTEIWTHSFAIGERQTNVVVDFFVPIVAIARIKPLRDFFVELYTRLYDEDVWMMTVRQERLDALSRQERKESNRRELGPLDEVRKELPLLFELGSGTFRLLEVNGQLIAHSVVCPHMLGPLEQTKIHDKEIIECPWHGYRFDLSTGSCLSSRHCRLTPRPIVQVDPVSSNVTVLALDSA